MAEIKWSVQATEDLDSISEYIAADSVHYANLFVINVMSAVENLEHFPFAGRVVPELGDESIREILHGNYRIVYRANPGIAEILTVYHSARLLPFL